MHTHSRARSHALTHERTHAYTHAQHTTHTHARTHARTHTHTHTHTHLDFTIIVTSNNDLLVRQNVERHREHSPSLSPSVQRRNSASESDEVLEYVPSQVILLLLYYNIV